MWIARLTSGGQLFNYLPEPRPGPGKKPPAHDLGAHLNHLFPGCRTSVSDPQIVCWDNLANTFQLRVSWRKSSSDTQREVTFVQCIFHDKAAIAQIYSACLSLPVSVLPAITFFPHVLFRNSEMTGPSPSYQESAVPYAARCTQEEEDKEWHATLEATTVFFFFQTRICSCPSSVLRSVFGFP